MSDEEKKVSSNRQKKMAIVTELSEKFGKAKAVVFTNYQGITHKQLEGFKKAIKPLNAEYVVAKNSLLTLALDENKIKLSEDRTLDGQTGTLFLYEDVISPLKALAKIIKELNLPSVKFGIMENDFVTEEQVLKLSTLPTKEVLLAQLVGNLKGPIYGLHRALSWNLQKLVMTLNAVVGTKPALAVAGGQVSPITEPVSEPDVQTPVAEEPANPASEPEPETILAETSEEKQAEEPVAQEEPKQSQEENKEEVKVEGGEN
ncbi:MAG TPA: 50S ribosomal protein L10 [Candidatus Sulfotelmatobacter sp.]|nr:50S ribosomal protein L10 [Candidatus Sulfotelmatobacter sp.]